MQNRLNKHSTRTDLASKIRTLRIAKGMTQQQFAEVLGVSRQAVMLWETGETKPSPRPYKEIEEAYEAMFFEIMGNGAAKGDMGKNYRECLRLVSGLSVSCLQSLDSSINNLLKAKTKGKIAI